ncbi:flagellar basal body-associated protein FliL [Pseudorhodobacter sp. W20_MBD10_FR17]|uniref:flagellar basal body-associated protein FliL n=1 Tax=Pseudorhodobacter sp. W20_MBD10_FR17 TaxID=3240266 RepID=UPI003F976815
MKAIFLPIILVVLGLAVGVGGGISLRPTAERSDAEVAEAVEAPILTEFLKLNNQFVVPVVEHGRVTSMVIMSLSLEVTIGTTESIYAREPKLRDAMLQVMFDHANAGGFNGVFTEGANLVFLRKALLEVSQKIIGNDVRDVLISDISRQDS